MGQSFKIKLKGLKRKMPIQFDTWEFPEGTLLSDVRYYDKPECLEIIYHDPITNRLEVSYRKPIIDIWFIKEEYRSECITTLKNGQTIEHQIPQIELTKCYPKQCKPSQVAKVIAEEIGGPWLEKYETNKDVLSSYDLKRMMCECPYVMKADFEPDVYFRLNWLHKHGLDQDLSKVSYALLDIEIDVLERSHDMKDINNAPVPINAITVILPTQKICAVLILAPRPENRLHPKFHGLLKNQKEEYEWMIHNQEEFKRRIIEDDEDNKKLIGDFDIRLHFFDYDKEINLIKTAFDYINKYRPWFCLSWNAKFDHPYMMNRIKYLGYDPYEIIIPSQFQTRQLYYEPDKSKRYAIKTSTDWFHTSTFTIYACQQRLYAQIRKSQKEQRSYSLNAIGYKVAKIRKKEDAKEGVFRQFAYLHFLLFILYNVRDVVVQFAVELKNNDCRTFASRSYTFATRYNKCFKETHIVRNCREYYFEQSGYVQACRMIEDSGLDTAFKGAYVAPPEHNSTTGLILNGRPMNNIIYGALDADAKSYYPSTKVGMNMNGLTLLYKSHVNNHETFLNGLCINRSFNQEYVWYDNHTPPRPHDEDLTGPILNAYKNKNECSVMYNWFNLPSETEYFNMIDELVAI